MSEPTQGTIFDRLASVPFLSGGFRPFFLLAAAWAALAVPLWLFMRAGVVSPPPTLPPLAWHTHELLFGFVPAVVAGFLLTAIPNWTGREPLTGAPLLALAAAWLAGRLAVFGVFSDSPPVVAALAAGFPLLITIVAGREILLARNRRNVKVIALVLSLAGANVLFHVEAAGGAGAAYGARLGVAVTLLLIMLIGGRIIPAFTRNWLRARPQGSLPAGFDRIDTATGAITTVALGAWVAAPHALATALLAVAAAAFNLLRLGRWAGHRTLTEPLVWILHLAFAFVPLGFLLLTVRVFFPGELLPSAPVHAWMAGATGAMTLAVMTRASLGHTGRPLAASRPVVALYVLVLLAAAFRLLAAFGIAYEPLLKASALAWFASFAGFVAVFAGKLVTPRADR